MIGSVNMIFCRTLESRDLHHGFISLQWAKRRAIGPERSA
jgi:hypothetical protein